jgi:16S rRNA (guanine1207-N2)-methyltransferase
VTAEDVYFKKLVTLQHRGQRLTFRVAQELFSSHEVDVGTQRLLRTLLDADLDGCRKVLDLGCGYGPIGLALKKADVGRAVHLVDRDALAVEYSRQNAALNGLVDVEVYGSLGYADVRDADFDLIVSNIPAKAGATAITAFLRDARPRLAPAGSVAVVVVSRLDALVERVLADPGIEVLNRKSWPGHTVYRYRFTAPASDADSMRATEGEPGIYVHENITLTLFGRRLPMRLAHDLPGLDENQLELLTQGLTWLGRAAPRLAVIVNPGQGCAPVAAWASLRPEAITLIDRDLLGLRVARANLVANGCPGDAISLRHQVGLGRSGEDRADLVAGLLRDDEEPAVHALLIQQAADQLAPAGALLVMGSATALSRLEAMVRAERLLKVRDRKRKRGMGVLLLAPNG